jgi:hypothetical protein
VRGCVPVGSDPGHDKGRLANHDAVNQVCEELVDCVRPSKVAFLFLAWPAPGPSSFIQSSELPLYSRCQKSGCSVLTLPVDRLIERAWFAVVDSPAQVARTFKATPRSWWFTQVRSAFGSSRGYRFSGDECPLPHASDFPADALRPHRYSPGASF